MHKITVILLSEYFQSIEKLLASLTEKNDLHMYTYICVKCNRKNKNVKK